MTEIIHGIQTKLKTIPSIKYVDEDWGQLDYYSPNFPVQWPCVLIDVADATFSNLGINIQEKPKNRQNSEISIRLTVANLRLTNSSGMATQFQKDTIRSIHTIIEEIHKILHGKQANEKTGKLLRKSLNRVKRDDGVQEYSLVYGLTVTNV